MTSSARIRISGPEACNSTSLRASKAQECTAISIGRATLTLGTRSTLAVRVRVSGQALAGMQVVARGAGIATSSTTDANGRLRLRVTPTRVGILRIAVPGALTCSKQLGVTRKVEQGVQLTG